MDLYFKLFTGWCLILKKKIKMTFANTMLTRCRFAYRLDIALSIALNNFNYLYKTT